MHTFSQTNKQDSLHMITPEPLNYDSFQDRSLKERRRTVRVKHMGLKKNDLEGLPKPAIKFAETKDEFQQAFELVYKVYLDKGFIPPNPAEMHYGIHSLLPDTAVFVAKSGLEVVSTMTEIFDSHEFGLPMDSIYKEEVDRLRDKGNKIVEVSSLATPRDARWKNFFMYLMQVWYWYTYYLGVDEVCIAVNPRHERFYRNLLQFEKFGERKHYSRVDAPAVGLRVSVKSIKQRMENIYNDLGLDLGYNKNLFEYYYRMKGELPDKKIETRDSFVFDHGRAQDIEIKRLRLSSSDVSYFLHKKPGLLDSLTPQQREYLYQAYPWMQN